MFRSATDHHRGIHVFLVKITELKCEYSYMTMWWCGSITYFTYMWYPVWWGVQTDVFRKSVEKIQVSLKPDKNNWHFTWRPMYIFITSPSFLRRMKNVSYKRCREKQNTQLCLLTFSRKSWRLWNSMEKFCRIGQSKNDIMAHVHCLLDTYGYKRTQNM
jgi:hypothetical protein